MAQTQCTIFGDGEQTRDFVFVDDIVQANLLAADAPIGNYATAVANVGRGEKTSLNQILSLLEKITGNDVSRTYESARIGDIKHSYADIQRAEEWFGYSPKVSLEDGLRQTLEWFDA